MHRGLINWSVSRWARRQNGRSRRTIPQKFVDPLSEDRTIVVKAAADRDVRGERTSCSFGRWDNSNDARPAIEVFHELIAVRAPLPMPAASAQLRNENRLRTRRVRLSKSQARIAGSVVALHGPYEGKAISVVEDAALDHLPDPISGIARTGALVLSTHETGDTAD